MTWLQPLEKLSPADLPQVGYKAYYLGLLSQHQLPVVAGQVVTNQAWQTVLAHCHWPPFSPLESLTELDVAAFQTLQHASQDAQRLFRAASLSSSLVTDSLVTELEQWPYSTWILRASLGLEHSVEKAAALVDQSILPARLGAGSRAALEQAIQDFWQQALTARSLVVWQRYCQHIRDLKLATLVMPIYPAQASGTLTLLDGWAGLEAVLGLGLPLSQGEAIPARCRFPLTQPEEAQWVSGFQEQVYAVVPEQTPLTLPQGIQSPVQVTRRDRPELAALLTPDQLRHLVDIGQAAQAVLAAYGAHPPTMTGTSMTGLTLEWMLCASSDSPGWQFFITQANPHYRLESAPAVEPQAELPAPRGVSIPPLPSVSAVVRGIGASSGQVQGVAVVALHPHELPRPLPANAVVVMPDLQPDAFLQLDTVVGIVTERGGATCHAAILAREMGIPAVVGAPQATQLLDPDAPLWLDGDRGIVYGFTSGGLPPPPTQRFPSPSAAPPGELANRLSSEQLARYRAMRTKVMANLSQIRRLADLPIDPIAGIGLLRSEWLLLDVLDDRHPWDWVNQGQGAELQSRIVRQLEPILQVIGPKPLRYRSLDLRSHEWQALTGSPPVEPNPMLGLRGTLSYGVDSRLFQIELAALANLQRAGYTNLQLILPFVRTVEEVLTCQTLIQQAGLTDYDDFALWIMAEVPSVLFLLPAYAQAGVKGIAIGSNDLTQLLLAVDRDQPIMASAYNERHPVVQMALAHLVQEARRCGMACSICGQAPVRYPDLIADLVAWGISSISVEAAALPFTLEAVWQAEQG